MSEFIGTEACGHGLLLSIIVKPVKYASAFIIHKCK